MNAEIYAEWLRRQGQHVVRTSSAYWHNAGMRVYQAFPYHRLIEPKRQELSELFLDHGAVAVRYSVPAWTADGCASYHVAYEGTEYRLEHLSAWARKNVRRGIRSCVVEPISFERLTEEGWALAVDSLSRQRRGLHTSRETWADRWRAAAGLPGFRVWGAQVRDRLGAFLVTFRMEECGCLLYQQCHRDFLPEHVNNALTFTVSQALLAEPGMRALFYGLQSLDAPSTVDEFKFRMGYQPKPVRQKVLFSPYLAPFVNRLSYALVKRVAGVRPWDRTLSKAEGMIRFYLSAKVQAQERLASPA